MFINMTLAIRPALQNCPNAAAFLRAAITLAGTNPNELASNTGIARGKVYSWTRGVDFSGPEIEVIAKKLALNVDETRALTLLRFPMLDEENLRQLPKRNQAGALLKTYRELAGLSQSELGKELGIGTTNNFSLWETGAQTIPKERVDTVIKTLTALLKKNPYFNAGLFKEAINNSRLRMGRPTIAFGGELPASHSLCNSPDEVIFLQEALHRNEVDVATLGSAIAVDAGTINSWLQRSIRMDESKLMGISTALKLSDKERDHFVALCFPVLAADALPNAGALLKAYREMAGVTQVVLSKALGCSASRLYEYESGGKPILEKDVKTIVEQLAPALEKNPYFKPHVFKETVKKSASQEGGIRSKKPLVGVVPVSATANLNGEWNR